MWPTNQRSLAVLVCSLLLLFCAMAGILVQVMPGPHRDVDYLVIGAVSTMACLLGVFGILLLQQPRRMDVFCVRRRRATDAAQAPAE